MPVRIGVVVIALLVSACSGASSTEVPVPRGPGTKLADGFVVAKGSHVVGPVFWLPDCPQCSGGTASRPDSATWQALLVVDRDPVAVFDAYAAQARRLGVKFRSSGDSLYPGEPDEARFAACVAYANIQSLDGGDLVPLGSPDAADAEAIRCFDMGDGVVDGKAILVSLEVRWGGPTRHALLTVERQPEGYGSDASDADGTRAASPAHLPAVSETPTRRPGQVIGTATNAISGQQGKFRLEAGSELAAEALAVGHEFTVVLFITGDVSKVMAKYAAQVGPEPLLQGADNRPPIVRRLKVATGQRVLQFAGGPHDGGYTEFVADPTGKWVLLYAYSD